MASLTTPPEIVWENRILLCNITWETYERLLRETGDDGPRMTYDRGMLELRSPTPHHEKRSRRLSSLIETIASVWEIDLENFGSTTFKLSERNRGAEPDACFYIARLPLIEGREEIQIEEGDPAPDLILEVDLTSPSLDKLPLYAALDVPEVWRMVDEAISILVLQNDGRYAEATNSRAFPTLSMVTLNTLMRQGRLMGRAAWLRSVASWAQENIPVQSEG